MDPRGIGVQISSIGGRVMIGTARLLRRILAIGGRVMIGTARLLWRILAIGGRVMRGTARLLRRILATELLNMSSIDPSVMRWAHLRSIYIARSRVRVSMILRVITLGIVGWTVVGTRRVVSWRLMLLIWRAVWTSVRRRICTGVAIIVGRGLSHCV